MSEFDLNITLGVEEEFFLVDPDTRDLESDPNPGIFEACEQNRGPHTVAHEVLRTQIETSTRVCGSVTEACEAVRETRRLVIEAAAEHGVAVLAASTHPFAEWKSQLITPRGWWKIWWRMPTSSAASGSFATCSPSFEKAAAPTAGSTFFGSAGWRAAPSKKRCGPWSIW